MSISTARLELWIDVMGLSKQKALALPDLKPSELIGAVLAEFHDLEELGSHPAAYHLVRAADGTVLAADRAVGEQIANGEHLALVEPEMALPSGATRPAHSLYLREQASGHVFRLGWLPAIIGRTAPDLPGETLLAIDLENHSAGRRVSRRHAQVIARDGCYLIEQLASNPLSIIAGTGQTTRLEQHPLPLCDGDTLLFEQSQIALTFLVRERVR
jgi:hypothetical protein